MRKIAFFIPLVLLPFVMNAQNTPIDKLFDKYYGKDGFTTVLVNEEMFEVIAKAGEAEGDLDGPLGKIKRVRVIAQDDEFAHTESVNFMDELKGSEFEDYEELVVVKEADQEVLIMAKEEGGKLIELLVLVGGEENVLVSVEGKFTMDDLEGLSDIDGLDVLGDVMH